MASPIVFIEKSRGKFKLIKYSLFQYLQQKGLCCIVINGISFLAIEFEDKFIIINQDELLTYVQKWINQDYINGVDYYTLDDIWNCVFDNFTSFFKSGVLGFLSKVYYCSNKDTKESCFLYFENGFVEITQSCIGRFNVGTSETKPIQDDTIKHNIEIKEGTFLKGEYVKFIWLIAGKSQERFKSLVSVVGYLVHRYKDPSNPKIIILLDQIVSDSEGAQGGVGKSLLVKTLRYVRNIFELGGKSFNSNYTFSYEGVDERTAIYLSIK